MTDLPVACSLSDAGLRERREGILRALRAQVQEVRPVESGYGARRMKLAGRSDLRRRP